MKTQFVSQPSPTRRCVRAGVAFAAFTFMIALPDSSSLLGAQAPARSGLTSARVAPHIAASAVGTLLVAHGGGPAWDANVEKLASSVQTGGPVAVSLLMGPGAATHRFQDAVAQLVAKGAKEVVVVPVLVSSHSGHIQQIRYLAGETDSLDTEMMHHLHMSGITRPKQDVPIRVAAALDNSPELARVLADHARSLATDPAHQALFLIGHGPNDAENNAAWMSNLRQVADSVRAWTGFNDIKIGLVRDDAPAPVRAEAVKEIRETILLQHAATRQPVVVVPILVSSGTVVDTKIPHDLEDLPIIYRAVPLLPHPMIARWVEARVRDIDRASTASPAQEPAVAPSPSAHIMQ